MEITLLIGRLAFLAVKVASDCDTLWPKGLCTRIPHSLTHTGVCALREALYCTSAGATAAEQAKEDLGSGTSWRIHSYIMRCGLLAGHSQQGTADLNINTVSP